MKIFVLSSLALATYVSATCDDNVTAANAINLTQACVNDIQGGTPPTIATVLSDWQSNANSVYQFGICGSSHCLSQFHELQQTYDSCTPTNVTSYSAVIQALNTTCDNVTSTVGNYTGTCNTTNYADIFWAKNVATLSTDCATALNSSSYNSSSNWYSVVQAITLTSNNLTNAFCGSAACLNLTTDNKVHLPNCTSNTGDNLHNTTTNLLAYCHQVNNPTTTAAPNTTTAAPSTPSATTTTAAPPNTTTTAAPSSNSTSSPTPTPASTTPSSNSSNATTTTAPDTITLAPNATTTAAPEVATTTTAPSSATTTVAPASATTTVAATTVAPTTATPTPTPTQSSASTISGLFAVALAAAVLA